MEALEDAKTLLVFVSELHAAFYEVYWASPESHDARAYTKSYTKAGRASATWGICSKNAPKPKPSGGGAEVSTAGVGIALPTSCVGMLARRAASAKPTAAASRPATTVDGAPAPYEKRRRIAALAEKVLAT